MNYQKAIEKVKKYTSFVGKQMHIEEHREKITIKKVMLCEIISSKGDSDPKPEYIVLDNLDLMKDNSEKLKDKNLDVIVVYEKSILNESIAADFNKKYPLL